MTAFVILLMIYVVGFAPKGTTLFIFWAGIFGMIKMLRNRCLPKVLKTVVLYPLCALLLLALLSFFWSEQPYLTEKYSSRFLIIWLFALAATACIDQMAPEKARHILCCLAIGCLSGLAIASLFSMAYFFQHVVGTQVSPELTFQQADLARQIAKSLCLAVVLLFALAPFVRQYLGKFFYPFLVLFVPVIVISDSQSAFLSLLLGSIFYVLAQRNPILTGIIFIIGLAFSFLMVLPLADLNYRHKHKMEPPTGEQSSVLQSVSYDSRSGIYKFFADKSMDKPVLGHGFFAGRIYKPDPWPAFLHPVLQDYLTPHNLQLQILFDLGYVGALLFIMLVGMLLHHGLNTLPAVSKPALMASAAAFVGATAFNFLLWQPWMLSFFASLCLIFLLQKRTADVQATPKTDVLDEMAGADKSYTLKTGAK